MKPSQEAELTGGRDAVAGAHAHVRGVWKPLARADGARSFSMPDTMARKRSNGFYRSTHTALTETPNSAAEEKVFLLTVHWVREADWCERPSELYWSPAFAERGPRRT